MEWVETTGKTLEAAKDAALDELGVDEADAEFEILEQPRRGLFGLLGAEARVRARVRPTVPRPKEDRRDRRRRGRDRGRGRGDDGAPGVAAAASMEAEDVPADRPASGGGAVAAPPAPVDRGDEMTEDDLSIAEQGELARTFVEGLVRAFGFEKVTVAVNQVDDETVEVAVNGDDLGLLIGPKGQTLQAVQELARTVVQRNVIGRYARLHVDVAGYREKRRAALARFAQQVAEQVRASGARRVLEPMTAPDRKVVHDVVNEIEGVTTTSEGEEPRRRVVVLPAES